MDVDLGWHNAYCCGPLPSLCDAAREPEGAEPQTREEQRHPSDSKEQSLDKHEVALLDSVCWLC